MKEILYYNVGFIRELMKVNPGTISEFITHNSDEIFKIYEKYGMNLNVVYDRTGNTPHYLKIKKGLHPIPEIGSFNKSFKQCVEERAKELIALNKRINVVWSGGIDSTLVLFALLKQVNDPKQITVYGTYTSILESGYLFEKYIMPTGVDYYIKYTSVRDFEDRPNNEIFVTGFFGNQLFGPVDDFTTGTVKSEISFFHHQFNNPDPLIDYTKCITDELHEFLLPSIKSSPKKIETLRDLRWWLIFNFDWYTSEYNSKVNNKQYNNLYHFFNTEDFQRYVLSTKEPFTKDVGNPLTHRWVMRQLIEEWSGDSYYAWNKPKGISNLHNLIPSWLFLLEDLSVYYMKNNMWFDVKNSQNRLKHLVQHEYNHLN